jgi:Tol biopolymer transport system component
MTIWRTRRARARFVAAVGAIAAIGSAGAAGAAWVLPAVASEPAVDLPSTFAASVAQVGAHPTVADSGRWMVFEGEPPVVQADDDDAVVVATRASTIWLRDLSAELPVDVELTPVLGSIAPGDSVRPVISGDGCSVTFITQMALDLFRDDDTADRWDVYRLVLPHCGGDADDWELVSTRSDEGDTSALDRVVPSASPSVSDTGTVVAFTHRGRRGAPVAVSVVDLTVPVGAEGRIGPVAGTPLLPPESNGFRYLGQRDPSVSDDGRFVAFTSDADATAPVPEWVDGSTPGSFAPSQVYLWDREAPADGVVTPVVLVSQVAGAPSTLGATSPVVSGNGQFVAFLSSSPELAGDAALPDCTLDCVEQVYRYDQSTGQTTLVSRRNTGVAETRVAADLGALHPSITDDGSQIAFVTRARNLFPLQSPTVSGPGDGDIVVSEVDLGVLRRVSNLPDGITPAGTGNAHPHLSGTGRVLVFDSVVAGAIAGRDLPGRQVVSVVRPVQLSAPSLDVGTVMVGLPSDEWFVAVKNLGPSTFVPVSASVTEAQFTVTGGTCGLGLPVPPGQSCTVNVQLTPVAPGPVSGTIVVSEAPGGAVISTPVSGAGGEPTLYPEQSGLTFEATEVGESTPSQTAGIVNVGLAPTSIARISVVGAHPDDFVLQESGCRDAWLEPTDSCSVVVRFEPTDVGYRTGVVLVTTVSGAYTAVVVDGNGLRTATLDVPVTKIRAGTDIPIGGRGFRPGSVVTIAWADGRGASVSAVAGGDGAILAVLPTSANERRGARVIVAQTSEQMVSVPVEVRRRPVDPGL